MLALLPKQTSYAKVAYRQLIKSIIGLEQIS